MINCGTVVGMLRRLAGAVRGGSAAARQHPVAFPIVRLGLWGLVLAGLAYLAVSPASGGMPPGAAVPKLEDEVRTWVWRGVAGSVVLLLGLALTDRCWMAGVPGSRTLPAGPPLRAFWWMILPVLAVAGWLRAPLLSHSLYADEVYSITRFIHGDYKPGKDGQLRFRAADWIDTVWGYRRPNNHVGFSVVARWSHETWRRWTGAPRQAWNAAALRFPALLAGLGSIGLASFFLWRHGFPRAATVVAALLALHPWHISHSVEVRGYGFVFLFGTAVLGAAARALETGQWRWWLALAASQSALLLTYPTTVYILVPLVGVLAGLVWRQRVDTAAAWVQGRRLLVVNVLMTAVLLPLVLPWVPQLSRYLSSGAAPMAPVTAKWTGDVISLFLTGTAWHQWDPGNPLDYTMHELHASWPVMTWLAPGMLGVLGVLGYVRLKAVSPSLFWLMLPFWTAPVLAVVHAWWTGALIYTWYVIFSLPVWLMCLALGIASMGRLAGRGAPRAVVWLLPALAVGIFALVSHPQRKTIRAFSVEPLKEITEEMHRLRAEAPGGRALLAVTSASLQLYDPTIISVGAEDHLRRLQEQAKAEGVPLYLALNYLPLLHQLNPPLHGRILGSGEFLRLRTFHGLDFEHRNCLIFRYAPAP